MSIPKKVAAPKRVFKQAKREKSTSTVGHYVRNAELLPAVIAAKEKGVVTTELIKMIWMIADRYSRKSNFIRYSYRDDMVSAAVENLCKNALKFDHEKYDNPFAFYTTAIHRSFLQFMADEKKHRNLRDALLIDAGANPSFNFLQGEKSETQLEIPESDEAVHDTTQDVTSMPAALVAAHEEVNRIAHQVWKNEHLAWTLRVANWKAETAAGRECPAPGDEPSPWVEPEQKEVWRHPGRMPSDVVRMSGADVVYDEEMKCYVRKVA